MSYVLREVSYLGITVFVIFIIIVLMMFIFFFVAGMYPEENSNYINKIYAVA